ncbi:MAG: (E)-4-hydroxy-3-methylbut-2-enyl-diphosphate synthase, partial [Muribaculaceae bacterium]|nr:(E)-4-hydroxy-3-methylbut-2-enyl-diphosphate synthase [Muribaculaceae bacterium]
VNHGSLSDRIMSRYGDTPAGMVESAMEFLRVARKIGFNDIVISIKASNTVIMVETVRRLVKAMDAEDMHFPLHLGVTEAGDGEDGRVKSAVGIGTLLVEGIGDTIRVSLSENPANEIPVAAALVEYITSRAGHEHIEGVIAPCFNPINPQRRKTTICGVIGGDNPVAVVDVDSGAEYTPGFRPDVFATDSDMKNSVGVRYLKSDHINAPAAIAAEIHRMWSEGDTRPVVAVMSYHGMPYEDVALRAAADFGKLLIDRLVDGIMIDAPQLTPAQRASLAFRILQAARQRFTRTEYIACPGCGRTLFDLQSTLAKVKEATEHLKGLKIGVMGCVVNGPGEMADADFGYVGAGVGNVSLYRGKECVKKNLPADTALPELIQLIKDSGRWTEPDQH